MFVSCNSTFSLFFFFVRMVAISVRWKGIADRSGLIASAMRESSSASRAISDSDENRERSGRSLNRLTREA